MVALAASAMFVSCKDNKPASVNLSNEADSLSYTLGVANAPTAEQIKMYLMQAGSDSAYVDAFFQGMKDGLSSSPDKKEKAYEMGKQSGQQMKERMFASIEEQVFAGDSTKHLSSKLFLQGMLQAYAGETGMLVNNKPVTPQDAQGMIQSLMERMSAKANEKVFGQRKAESDKFMASKAKEQGVKALAKGVFYKELKAGAGATPKAGQVAELSYEGRLADGTVFDSSNGKGVDFPIGSTIPGFDLALQSMKEGAEWEIYIPWNQAYGERAAGQIPPYSALVFKVKLIKVKEAAQQQPQMGQPQVVPAQ